MLQDFESSKAQLQLSLVLMASGGFLQCCQHMHTDALYILTIVNRVQHNKILIVLVALQDGAKDFVIDPPAS